jgi:hypothetical protein
LLLEHIPVGSNRDALSILWFAHVLLEKQVSTFPGHALAGSLVGEKMMTAPR